MIGNVVEWCWDGHDPAYYGVSPLKDPLGPNADLDRVIRGMGYITRATRIAFRAWESPTLQDPWYGIRLVRTF